MFACEALQRTDCGGVDLEGVARTAVGGDRWTRMVERQFERLGQVSESFGPVGQFACDETVRIVLGSEQVTLPQGVIRILHGERRPRRRLTAATRVVGDHHVAGQRSHREAVRGNVVHDEDEHVFVVADPVEAGADRHLRGDVESGVHEFDDGGQDVGLVDRHRCEVRAHLCDGQHDLVPDTVDLRVDGAQDLVAREQIRDGVREGRQVQRAGEADGDRDVVRGGVGVEAVEEPHPLLRERQRYRVGSRLRLQCRAATGAGVFLGPHGQCCHGGCLEQHTQRDTRVECGGESRDDLGGDQRVAAEFEEVVVRTDAVDAEQVPVDAGDDLLDRGGRRAVRAGRDPGTGSALRSILPFALSGNASRIMTTDGTM